MGADLLRVHFHGGPWAGLNKDVEPHQLMLLVHEEARTGTYTADPQSAGGRCYEWRGWL